MIPPINFPKWLEENSHRLQPPVNNFCLWNEKDITVMVVGGPNKRTDYHVNPTEEWFYQIKGNMLLKIVENETEFRDVEIREGDMFLLPGNIPHNPVRFADTVGIVLERQRPQGRRLNQLAGQNDHLRWYCSSCHQIVYQESFFCTDLGVQLKPVIERFAASQELRTCKNCGTVNEAK